MHNLINVLNCVHSLTIAFDNNDQTYYTRYKVFTDEGTTENKQLACTNLPELLSEILNDEEYK